MKGMRWLLLIYLVMAGPDRSSALFTAQFSPAQATFLKTDTLWADPQASVVKWKGTKFMGMGSHAGLVRLHTGYLLYGQRQLRGGSFVIDMSSLENTDIPESDPVPRRKLISHLKGKDFFEVERYPRACFVITRVGPPDKTTQTITGDLTIKGITSSISFPATSRPLNGGRQQITAAFRINRHWWGIDYKGSRLTNDLIDDDIYFQVILIVNERQAE